MESIVGTWKPYARQSPLSPVRPMKANGFATLVIQSNGRGRSRRETLFNNHDKELAWMRMPDDYGHHENIFLINISGIAKLNACVDNDEMKATVTSCAMSGMNGTTFFFRRVE